MNATFGIDSRYGSPLQGFGCFYRPNPGAAPRAILGSPVGALHSFVSPEWTIHGSPGKRYRFRQIYLIYPSIVDSLTPQSLMLPQLQPLMALLPNVVNPNRESLSPESEIVESVTPQLIHRLSFSHQNLGQLNTYVAYYKKHEMTLGDQPPVGILLCTRKNEALVEFALGDTPNQLFVSPYAVEMPDKKEMETFLRQIGKDIHNEDE